MKSRLTSPRFLRALTWASALVLIAGVVAFVTVWIGDTDNDGAVVNDGQTIANELPATTAPDVSDVPAAAREAAVKFLMGAVARQDLAAAWKVAHPQLKKDCNCTYEEWLKGDINVQFFPVRGPATIRFNANEIAPGHVVLEVLLDPKKGSDLAPTAFYVGLRSVGSGAKMQWLADYFAPAGSPPVPRG